MREYPRNHLCASLLSLLPVTTQYNSCVTGHDGPKVSHINQQNYDWWYFDAVSTDGTESIVVIFFTASAAGFPFEFTSTIYATTVTIFATYADGTSSLNLLLATGATITTAGDGASGTWSGAGASFSGASDLSAYDITINNPLGGVSGTFHLESVCSPPLLQGHTSLTSHVAWSRPLSLLSPRRRRK